jgi:hypothetical protein
MRTLSLVGLLVAATVSGGCGSDINAHVACTSTTECQALGFASGLFDKDASIDFLPQCCASLCLVASLGCDSGYRYLIAAPAVGECAPASATTTCVAPPPPDLAMPPEDMSGPPDMSQVD